MCSFPYSVNVDVICAVKRILAAKSIKATPAMAPAHGLYLADVKYNFDVFKTQENMVTEDEADE